MSNKTDSHHDSGDSAAQRIAEKYQFSGDVLELGTVVVDETVDPTAKIRVPLAMMNRHGLIAGATGTGKTVTLQLLAESLSAAGVPVLLADIKGDLSGLSRPGSQNDTIASRIHDTGCEWKAQEFPTEFTSIGSGGIGIPLRAKIESFGSILFSKVLNLNETQESTLGLVFHWAHNKGFELYNLQDLQASLSYLVSPEGAGELAELGGVSKRTVGVIQRHLSVLESQGGDTFFGEPEINTQDLMRVIDGKGVITLFELADQTKNPALFSTFLMWILSDLFAHLPEVGDQTKPKLVFIFDEAHTLFHDASKAFIDHIVQTVKLIRSKGVGIFFCSQLPTDIPNSVLSQLGTRIQHALRAFTPEDQKALSKTVKTYPTTKDYDLPQALTSLGIGEAIVTVLSEKGAPTPVAWTRLRPPQSHIGEIGRDNVRSHAQASPLWNTYAETQNSDSAEEKIAQLKEKLRNNQESSAPASTPSRAPQSRKRTAPAEANIFESIGNNSVVKNFVRTVGTTLGKEISRNLFGKKK